MTRGTLLVPPLSRAAIREVAQRLRAKTGQTAPYVDIISVFEHRLPMLDPDYEWSIADDEELGDAHGITYPDQSHIRIAERVYVGAARGMGRDRFTIAHEIGHYIFHRSSTPAFLPEGKSVPIYRDPEWQANTFAGEFLVCYRHLDGCRGPGDLTQRFGVTLEAAKTQWEVFKRDELVAE
jgi:hypothetical protein